MSTDHVSGARGRLYPWQEECLKLWLKHGARGIVEAVTGSGKTRLALEACERLREIEKQTGQEGRLLVKIVVPTAALMRQWARALREFSEKTGRRPEIGLCGGGRKPSGERETMIFVVNSARYVLARQILEDLRRGDQVLLIADECHHYTSEANRLIFEFLPQAEACGERFFSLGLSATLPTGENRQFLVQALGSCIYSYGIRRALTAQTVCRYDIFHVEIPLRNDEREAYGEITERMQVLYLKLERLLPGLRWKSQSERMEDLRILAARRQAPGTREAALYLRLTYLRKKVVCLASARNDCAVLLVRRLGNCRILIFGERIIQAEELYCRLVKLFPGEVGRCHSKMGPQANKNTLERFRDGELRILIACKSLDEGLDVPDVSVGIILSGTSVRRQRVQRLGRMIRNAEGKKRASLYYLHAAKTSEETCFLPDGGEERLVELNYLPRENRLFQEAYERLAGKLLESGRYRVAAEPVSREIRRCLELGSIRADWLAEPEELDDGLRGAADVREKNYWLCMKKLAALRDG